MVNYGLYDKIIVFFSGGKDSVACVLSLIESGVSPDRIELHHHLVDGSPDSNLFMDWAVTEDYCKKFAAAFGLKIYFSWKEGGFEGEMLREDSPTKPIAFYDHNEQLISTGGNNPRYKNTRLKFPQQAASLSSRWCSAYLKVDVGDRLMRKRFIHDGEKKYLVITGERAEESSARAKYKTFEAHRSDLRNGKKTVRYIDHSRIVHKWDETRIWQIMEDHMVNPHPAYLAGFGRTSCMGCIFGSKNQWATIKEHAPDRFQAIHEYEGLFETTISRSKKTIDEMASQGTPYQLDSSAFDVANSREYNQPIIVDSWELPRGAYGENCGAL